MDPSVSSTQKQQTQIDQSQSQAQPATMATPPAQPAQNQRHQTPFSVPSNVEEGGAVLSQEVADKDEEEIQVAPQEGKTQVVQQGSTNEAQEIEMQPSVPEVTVEKSVESVVEKSPDVENPLISQEARDAGLTHSGPGVIDVSGNTFGVMNLPVTYQQAVEEEKQAPFKDSRHWFAALMMYIWRKLNPNLGKKGQPSETEQPVPVASQVAPAIPEQEAVSDPVTQNTKEQAV